MDPKYIDQLLKEKLSDVKEQKRHEQMVGLVALLGENISEDIKNAVSAIKIDVPKAQVDVNIPEIKIPDIPAPQVTVNVPEIKLPEFKFEVPPAPEAKVTVEIPEIVVPEPKVTVNVEKQDPPIVNIPPFPEEMRVFGDVNIAGVDRKNPMPVQMVDGKGNPMQFPVSGGGRGDFFTIKDIQDSAGNSVIDRETGAMKITGNISVASVAQSSVSLVNADGNYYNSDNPLPITGSISTTPGGTYYASDAVGSVNIVQSIPITVTGITNSTATAIVDSSGVAYSGSNPLPVSGSFSSTPYGTYFASDTVGSVNVIQTVGLTNTELRANSIDVQQASGASWSTNVLSLPNVTVSSVTNSIGATILNGEGLARDTWGSSQVGTWNINTVTGITNSVGVNLLDSSGVGYSGTNPVPVVITSGASATSASNIVDSTGVAYTGSNPLPVVITSGASATSASNIVDSSGVAYSGSNPVPITMVSGSLTSTGAYLLNGDGTYRDTVPVSGTVTVGSITNSTAVTLLNGEGLARDSWLVSDITNSLKSALIDSTGVQYSGSNPLPSRITDGTNTLTLDTTHADGEPLAEVHLPTSAVIHAYNGTSLDMVRNYAGEGNALRIQQANDAISSVWVTGSPDSMITFMARTTLPTSKTDGADVRPIADKIGRQVFTPVQVRDLIGTAFVTLTGGTGGNTETTLLAGATGQYLDLISVSASTTSLLTRGGTTGSAQGSITLTIRESTGGGTVTTLAVPSADYGSVTWTPAVPYPQANANAAWTVQAGTDLSGTVVTVTALFAKNI